MRKCFTFSLLALLLAFNVPVFAQPTFFKTYGGNGSDYGEDVTLTPNNEFLLTMIGVVNTNQDTAGCYPGSTSKYAAALLKTDYNGEKIWEKQYWLAERNQGVKTIVDKDGNYVMAGIIAKGTGVITTGMFVLKTDTSGNIIWAKEYSITASDMVKDLLELPGGGYLVLFSGDDNVWYERVGLCKLDTDGNVQKCVVVNRPGAEVTPESFALLNNHIYVAGSGGLTTFTDVILLKFDLNLNVVNTKNYSTFYDDFPLAITAKNGSIYVTGNSFFMATYYDAFVIRLDENLNTLKEAFFDDGSSDGDKWRVITPSDNGIAVFGDVGSFDARNCMMAELDENLDILWSKQYAINPVFTNYVQGAATIPGKGFVWTGDVRPPTSYRNAALVKTDRYGNAGCITEPLTISKTTEGFNNSVYTMLDSVKPVAVTNATFCGARMLLSELTYCEKLAPVAAIKVEEDLIECGNFCFNISDRSLNNPTSWQWAFTSGNPAAYVGQNPGKVCFTETGEHIIKLITTNNIGTDTIFYTLNIDTNCELQYAVPNAFTPNGDGVNDIFEIIGDKANWEEFTLVVYNRWGEPVFSSTNAYFKWEGDYQSKYQPAGNYYYTATFNYLGALKSLQGNITLLR